MVNNSEKEKDSSQLIFANSVLYIIIFILVQVFIQLKLIAKIPPIYATSGTITVIISSIVKGSIVLLAFATIFILNKAILEIMGFKIKNFELLNSFAIIISIAIFTEISRLILAYFTLFPLVDNIRIKSVEAYHLLLNSKIPKSPWSLYQNILDMSFCIYSYFTIWYIIKIEFGRKLI